MRCASPLGGLSGARTPNHGRPLQDARIARERRPCPWPYQDRRRRSEGLTAPREGIVAVAGGTAGRLRTRPRAGRELERHSPGTPRYCRRRSGDGPLGPRRRGPRGPVRGPLLHNIARPSPLDACEYAAEGRSPLVFHDPRSSSRGLDDRRGPGAAPGQQQLVPRTPAGPTSWGPPRFPREGLS